MTTKKHREEDQEDKARGRKQWLKSLMRTGWHFFTLKEYIFIF